MLTAFVCKRFLCAAPDDVLTSCHPPPIVWLQYSSQKKSREKKKEKKKIPNNYSAKSIRAANM